VPRLHSDGRSVDRQEIWSRIEAIQRESRNPVQLKTLIGEWEKDFGQEYKDLAEEVLADNVRKEVASWAKRKNLSTLEDLIRNMWETWTEGEFTIERTENDVQIHCTRCPIADTYRSIGREEYGFIFHCSGDAYIVSGFNPKMRFRRTKTLMNGDDCCDHHYSMD